MEAEAEALVGKRFAIVTVWRAIRVPAARASLAICDARSKGAGDSVPADLVYRDRRAKPAGDAQLGAALVPCA